MLAFMPWNPPRTVLLALGLLVMATCGCEKPITESQLEEFAAEVYAVGYCRGLDDRGGHDHDCEQIVAAAALAHFRNEKP